MIQHEINKQQAAAIATAIKNDIIQYINKHSDEYIQFCQSGMILYQEYQKEKCETKYINECRQ